MRADTLSTKREVLATFRATASVQVMAVLVAIAAIARVRVWTLSWADAVVVAVSLMLVGVVEWVLHLFLLHAPVESRRMRILKTGVGHRQHHLDPGALEFVLLRPIDTAVFGLLIAAGTAAWTVPLSLLMSEFATSGSIFGPVLTGLLLAYLLLFHYEWTHLLVHTRYRPKTAYYRRLARNHRLHHYRNERFWLGVTSNLGDRVFGTYPAAKSAVPLSETARNLG
jgi:sterol desaturase/sphingolipid hydroxylase (fatty acid hydroxylase superfamily)